LLNGRSNGPAAPLDPRLDLNQASRDDLNLLPGVGPALAERIATYREKNGPFHSVDDLAKVSGIGPVTLQRLRDRLVVAPCPKVAPKPDLAAGKPKTPKAAAKPAGPLDPNSATLAELDTLPGIGPKLAQRIIDERDKRPFARAEDLRRVKGIGPKTMEKIRPYLQIAEAEPAGAPR
jgi:competence protein ComEA